MISIITVIYSSTFEFILYCSDRSQFLCYLSTFAMQEKNPYTIEEKNSETAYLGINSDLCYMQNHMVIRCDEVLTSVGINMSRVVRKVKGKQ